MAYDEYNIFPPQEEPQQDIPIKDVLKNIVAGFESKKNWKEIHEATKRLGKALPGVIESTGRGALAGVPGSIGDLSEFARTYAPEAMNLKFGKNRTFPTTREILDYVPRITDTHEGSTTLEDVGSFIGPGVFNVGKDLALATKGMPVGLSMIGPESKLWKQTIEGVNFENQAFKASKLEAKGKTPEEIYKDTGMVRGLDNQWRGEITDFWSQMKSDKPFGQLWAEKYNETPVVSTPERKAGTVLVKDVFEHPELFKHYPELGEIKITPHSVSKPHMGQFDEGNNAISLRENLTPEEARSILHHELTHGIQGIENWNRGGNPKDIANSIARQGEVQTKMAEAQIRYLQEKSINNPNIRNTPEFINEWNMAHDKLDKAQEFLKKDPFEIYGHLGGEAEARMTQARLGLTQDQLREYFPYTQNKYGLDIDPDKAIITGFEPGVINKSQSIEKPYAVSTRVPTAVKAEEDALKQSLLSDYKAFRSNQEAFLHNVDLLKQYPNLALKSKNADINAEKFVEHVKDNLLYLHDKVPADTRARSKLWYEGANKIANDMAKDYGISEPTASGMLAVLSPQKDWFMNVSLAERVASTLAHKQSFKWDSAMSDVADVIYGKPQYKPLLNAIKGKRLEELTDPVEKAVWIRTHDQAHNPREHFVVTPEGDFSGIRMKENGEPYKTGWGSNTEIAKAVSIFDNPTRENIHARLGGEHKVRNFYMNIYDPFSKAGHTTIDTHAVAAGLLRPLSGNTREVSHNFGSNFPGEVGPKNSAFTGKGGTYGLYHEGYQRAAKERDILPREMQSITWEAVRGLFPDTFKNAKNVQEIEDIWKKHKSGKIDIDETRKQILEKAGGINEPEWKK
jgi:hypothetical protein